MFRPVAPSGFAQPMITSSISPGSSLARSIAWRSAWPPIVAPWVILKAPRQLLQSGVRAVETTTASGITDNLPHPHTKTAHRDTPHRAIRRHSPRRNGPFWSKSYLAAGLLADRSQTWLTILPTHVFHR